MPSRIRLGDVAYDSLRQLTKELPSGTRLSEMELAGRLGMSKTPVRDALRRMQSEGYVEVIPHVGYLIPHISYRDVREVFEIRQAIEGEAAALAAVRMDQAVLEKLAEHLAGLRAELPSDERAQIESLTRFGSLLHDQVLAGADNKRLVQILSSLKGQIERATEPLLRDALRPRQSLGEHGRLLEALVARDVAGAQTAMRDHLASIRDYVLARYR